MKKFLLPLLHFFSTTAGHALGTFLLGIFLTWLKAARDQQEFLNYAFNWRELISPFVVATLASVVVVIVTKYVREHQKWKRDRATLKKLGVYLFSSHTTDEEKRKDWSLVSNDLGTAGTKSPLWILGATGKGTFGNATSPLCETLRAYAQPIRVLLIRPYSTGFDRRVRELNVNAGEYASDVHDAIDFCVDLKRRRNKDIEVKVYSELAIWKMMITSSQLWLQHYGPKRHVDDMPMYCFEFLENEASLYDALKSVFLKRWVSDGNPSIDLVTWNRSAANENYWTVLT